MAGQRVPLTKSVTTSDTLSSPAHEYCLLRSSSNSTNLAGNQPVTKQTHTQDASHLNISIFMYLRLFPGKNATLYSQVLEGCDLFIFKNCRTGNNHLVSAETVGNCQEPYLSKHNCVCIWNMTEHFRHAMKTYLSHHCLGWWIWSPCMRQFQWTSASVKLNSKIFHSVYWHGQHTFWTFIVNNDNDALKF